VADPLFEEPRLAELYDPLDPDRSDLDAYIALTADSTLRFRSRDELANSLMAADLVVDEVRDAPDRPGREFVFVARRPA
jgi:hypothetical protein